MEEFEDTKGQSESEYPRRTDNTMVKRKNTKGQTTINKTSSNRNWGWSSGNSDSPEG